MNKATCSRLKNILAGKLKEVLDDIKDDFGSMSNEEEAKVLLVQLAYYVTAVKCQDEIDFIELNRICELSKVCCQALNLEKLSADSKFLTALYHIIKLLMHKERFEDVLTLLEYASVAAENYSQNNSSVDAIYLNIQLLFLDLSKSLKTVYSENRTKGKKNVWLHVLEKAFLILAYMKRTCLAQLFGQLTKHCNISEDTVDSMKSMQLRVFHTLRDHAVIGSKLSDFKAVYQQFCFMIATLLSSYFSTKNVEIAEEVLVAAFDAIKVYTDEQSIYFQCLMTFNEIILLFISKDVQTIQSRLKLCNSSVERLINSRGEDKEAAAIIFISASKVALDVRSHLWETLNASQWNSLLEVCTQTQLHYLLLGISQELGEKASDHTSLRLSVCLDSMVLHCIYKSACYNTAGFETMVPQAVSVLGKCINSLVVMKSGNPFWTSVWRAIAIECYKLASICMKLNLHSLVKDLVVSLYQGMLFLEESHVEPLCFEDGLFLTVDMLVRNYLEQKRFRSALLTCAVGIVSMPELRSRVFMLWADVKKQSLDDHTIQAITVQDVITTQKLKISATNPNLSFQGLNYCELTVMELEAYHNTNVYLPKSIEAAYSTVPPSQLIHYCRALYVKLNCMWQSQGSELCEEAIALCENAILGLKKAKKKCPVSEQQLYLFYIAQMHFCLFLHNFKKTHAKQKEEIEAVRVYPTNTVHEAGSIPDPNDVCDEVPAYASLTVVKEQGVLRYVDEAVSFWTEALAQETAPHKDVNTAVQFGDLEAAACIYYMYGYQIQGLKVWNLYYKLGCYTGNRRACLTALCHLMEVMVCKNSNPKLQEMEDLIVELAENSGSISSKTLLFLYYLSQSAHCYTNKRYEEGVQFLKKMTELSRYVNILLFVRFKVLAAKYLLLWPEVVTSEELGEPQVSLIIKSAFDYMHTYVTSYSSEKGNVCTYYQMLYVVFETSLFRGRLFLQLCWPREARSCLTEYLILVQKLSFATRTVQYLSVLAQVDVLCGALNDAEVKVTGMKYILNLKAPSFQDIFSPAKNEVEVDSLATQFESLKLNLDNEEEIWRDSGYTDDLGGSPVLYKTPFSMPKFVSHKDCCRCVWCANLAAQHLSLDITMLEAVLHYYHDDKKTALGFFKGGLRLAEMLTMKRATFLNQLCEVLQFPEQVCNSLCLPTCEGFCISKIKLMLHFSDMLCSQCLFDMAQKFIDYAVTLLGCVEDQNLWREVQMQQLYVAVLTEKSSKQVPVMEGETVDRGGEEESSPVPCNFKTPVCKAKQNVLPRRFYIARKMPESDPKIGSAMNTKALSEINTPRDQMSRSPRTEELEDEVFTSGSVDASSTTSYSRSLRKCKNDKVKIKTTRKPIRHIIMSPCSSSPEDGNLSKEPKGIRSCRKNSSAIKSKNKSRLFGVNKENKVSVYVDTSDDSPEKCYETPKQVRSTRLRTTKTESALNKQKKVLADTENAGFSEALSQTAASSTTAIKYCQTRKRGLKNGGNV